MNLSDINVWETVDAVLEIPGVYLGLNGPPGTGKSYAAQHSGLPKNKDGSVNERKALVCNLTVTEGTAQAQLTGHFVPMGDHFDWWDGSGAKAMRASMNGGGYTHVRVVINEIDRGSDELLSILYAIADSPESARLELPNMSYDVLRPNPAKFTVVATMNGEPEDLPDGLRDRFSWVHIGDVHPAALARLPEDLREPARASVLAEGPRRLSIRAWLTYATLRDKVEQTMAAHVAFGKQAQPILDALHVAEMNRPITAKIRPTTATIHNPDFDHRFSSWQSWAEDYKTADYYCGWCRTTNCRENDDYCRPMRFTNIDEHDAFVAAYSLDPADTEEAKTAVRRKSLTVRTASQEVSWDAWQIDEEK